MTGRCLLPQERQTQLRPRPPRAARILPYRHPPRAVRLAPCPLPGRDATERQPGPVALFAMDNNVFRVVSFFNASSRTVAAPGIVAGWTGSWQFIQNCSAAAATACSGITDYSSLNCSSCSIDCPKALPIGSTMTQYHVMYSCVQSGCTGCELGFVGQTYWQAVQACP